MQGGQVTGGRKGPSGTVMREVPSAPGEEHYHRQVPSVQYPVGMGSSVTQLQPPHERGVLCLPSAQAQVSPSFQENRNIVLPTPSTSWQRGGAHSTRQCCTATLHPMSTAQDDSSPDGSNARSCV